MAIKKETKFVIQLSVLLLVALLAGSLAACGGSQETVLSGDEKEAVLAYSEEMTDNLMAAADSAAIFMHCLPAHRGMEVTNGVIDSARSVVYDQAENRLHG